MFGTMFVNKAFFVFLFGLLTLTATSHSWITLAFSQSTQKNTAPSITFPNEKEMMSYLQQIGRFNNNFVDLSNSSNTKVFHSAVGNASDIQSATSPGISYVAFLSQSIQNKTNYVYLSITRDLLNHFQGPLRLSAPMAGDASQIQIAANGPDAFVVWQELNKTTGLSSIWASSSMDSGNTWHTWRVSLGGGLNAIDPSVTPSGIILWLQQVNQSGHAPSNITQSISSVPKASSNSASSDPIYHPYGHCCW
jgi:hypothetical protein